MNIYFLSSSDFTEALYSYRREQKTLIGLSLSQIEDGVLNVIRNKYPSEQVNRFYSVFISSIFYL